jgi:hypothetical protein
LQSAEAGSIISITWGCLAANTSIQGSNPQDRIATQGDILQQQAANSDGSSLRTFYFHAHFLLNMSPHRSYILFEEYASMGMQSYSPQQWTG